MKEAIRISGYGLAEKFVREISLMRRAFELLDFDLKEFDDKLTEWAEKYYKEFSNAGVDDLMILMQARLIGMEGDNDGEI